MKLPLSYFQQEDVVSLAQDLLGKILVTKSAEGTITGGRITETEAYDGTCDRASHAWPNKKTPRTSVMFKPGGFSYVYLCYGIHNLFNIVTGKEGVPHAILIRAIDPLINIEAILKRRNHTAIRKQTGIGPGVVTKALGIGLGDNNLRLDGNRIWLDSDNFRYEKNRIQTSTRVGVNYAGADGLLEWRFFVKNV